MSPQLQVTPSCAPRFPQCVLHAPDHVIQGVEPFVTRGQFPHNSANYPSPFIKPRTYHITLSRWVGRMDANFILQWNCRANAQRTLLFCERKATGRRGRMLHAVRLCCMGCSRTGGRKTEEIMTEKKNVNKEWKYGKKVRKNHRNKEMEVRREGKVNPVRS